MTNAELIQKIRAEIERRKEAILSFPENEIVTSEAKSAVRSMAKGLLSFISALESEKPMNQDELEKEIEAQLSIFPYTKVSPELPESRLNVIRKVLYMFARHFAEWGYLRAAEKYNEIEYNRQREEENVPKDLEEAAGEYEKKHTYKRYDGGGLTPEYDATLAEAFIAGAKWQAEQDKETIELAEEHAYLAGAVNEREKMMKEAVEGTVDFEYFGYKVIRPDLKQLDALLESMNHGDKVRVIVCKKDD